MSAFAEYATSTALTVSVSKPQVHMLNMLAQRYAGYCYPGWAHATLSALVRKGLIERHEPAGYHVDKQPIPWRLTEAGNHVHALAKLAGLVDESDRRLENSA